jgi:4-amino-4-deoxy-L-arabinose transferase-like glycosyltransferase
MRSVYSDLGLILANFGISSLIYNLLGGNTDDAILIVFGLPFVIATAMYLIGLVAGIDGIASAMFTEEEMKNIGYGLFLSSILVASFIFISFNQMSNPVWYLLFLAAFCALWILLHRYVAKRSIEPNRQQSRKKGLIATILMYPFMMSILVFGDALSSKMVNTHSIGANILEIVLMTIILWLLSFSPRRFTKAMLGIKMEESFFVLLLLIEVSVRVFLK